jgi:hypothetical protein
MKQCFRCKETKPKSEFNKDKSKSDGLQSYCHVCCVEYCKKYHENNRERELNCSKKYYENNRERELKRSKKYHENNRDPNVERYKKYRAELGDGYIKDRLKIKNPPQQLIEFKRDQLKLHRLIKELENEQQ